MLGTAALIVGVPALAFALFGWSQTVHPLFGDFTRYMCAFGGLGAMISGLLILKESLAIRAHAAQSVKEPALDFLVALDNEEQTVST